MKLSPFVNKIAEFFGSNTPTIEEVQNSISNIWEKALEEESRKREIEEKANRANLRELEKLRREIGIILSAVSLPGPVSEITKESIRITCKLILKEKDD